MTISAGPPVSDVRSAPITERRFFVPFVLITSLFFLWAFGVNLNDILIPRFKNAFALSDFQSSFIQVQRLLPRRTPGGPTVGKDRLQARHPYRFGLVRQRRSLIRAGLGSWNLRALPCRAFRYGLRPEFS